ncbi:PH domain-containing protein [Streptomyces malaysiensis]|uniref:Membrane protein n=1 Tax=Streptomyces malaysiensis TaxID=92644 RepID=A0A7X6B0D7_STRMQ|nr:PH domain-containing protein [Streptomyces malaysiensis]NIY68705.1 membrane protein [Streptomyces malaysiensis]
MPLPFLTADRAHDDDAAAGADPLGYEDQDRWRRPYRPGPWRVGGAALLLLLASYVLFSAMIIAMAGSLPAAGVCGAIGALMIVTAVRLVRSGVEVSPQGLRRIGLLRSTTVRWRDITAIRTTQQPVRWLGLPRTVQGQAVLLQRVPGGASETLFTSHDADFLGQAESFERAADAIEGWAATHH